VQSAADAGGWTGDVQDDSMQASARTQLRGTRQQRP
jgi:hypothetical protein